MNMQTIDIVIVLGVMAFFIAVAFLTKIHMKSAADFLAANRKAGRYMLTMATGMAFLGTNTFVAHWQRTYKVGLAASWWSQLGLPMFLILSLTGWVVYRYRETRALTLAQFMEMRYSRKFRIFAGFLCVGAGLVNYGVFPSVAARFFITYCGFPETYPLYGFDMSTHATLVVTLVMTALYFTLMGGQIAVIVTDFLQSLLTWGVLAVVLGFLLIKFPLSTIFEGLAVAEPGKSMLNPMDAGESDFSYFYFISLLFMHIYGTMAWQGWQGYNAAAKSPHEQKMAGVLAGYRYWAYSYAMLLIPLVGYAIMHLPEYADQAAIVTQKLSSIGNEQVRDQMLVPMTMTTYMPVGMMGAFAAMMLAAFISTNDTFMHSWGSIIVQDIVMPFRKKPFSPKQHIWALRGSTVGVALFALIWSLTFRQTQHLSFYFALTGAIWIGGAGSVIIGGLYSRWGTTAGGYAALIVGAVIASIGMTCHQMWEGWYGEKFFLDGQKISIIACVSAVGSYVLLSLLTRRVDFNLDKMLHRGKYSIAEDHVVADAVGSAKSGNWKRILKFGITKEFSRGDKIIYGFSIAKSAISLILFATMTTLALTMNYDVANWKTYHYYVIGFYSLSSFGIVIWLCVGGLRDLFLLFRDLKAAKRDDTDDGWVADHDYDEASE